MPEDVNQRRLLFALPFLHFGVGRLAIDLAHAAAAEGWSVDVLTCGGTKEMQDDPQQLAEIVGRGGAVHHADVFSRDPAVMRAASARVGTICRERQIAVIHAFTAPAAAASLDHRPVMCSVVGWAAEKAGWQRSMDAALLERCDIVTVVSEAVRAEVRAAGVTRPDVRLILHGVALDPSRDLARVDPAGTLTRIGVMAHLIERKGVDVLLRALAQLGPDRWRRLIVAGTGEAEAALRSLSAKLLPLPRVSWLGAVSTVSFFDQVDLVVVPSRSDALPLVLLQAMAYGVPVIASRVGGIPEAAAHPNEALLVEPGDPLALADAIAWTLADPPAALGRARAARRRVEHDFSLAAMAAQYIAGYAELCP
ncbi:MAG: hypothetical protein A3J29_06335 [Acidobacteria bacterium RIFCSPLOWO2_12_FULL_67_14b]|nr:MAG: hypothetical protein A3J29_06335 [Acidobacteria bacterium RIFCSPLOWO2_12_FULL_67_14b]